MGEILLSGKMKDGQLRWKLVKAVNLEPMLKVMGIDLFKRKVISWFFKPERDGWYIDEKVIDEDTIQHKVFHCDGEIVANYKIKKGESTEFTFATGFNTFINAEINGWSWFGPIDDWEYETSFTMRFGSKSFEGKKYAVFENAFEIKLSRM